jgi:hypothetical protein
MRAPLTSIDVDDSSDDDEEETHPDVGVKLASLLDRAAAATLLSLLLLLLPLLRARVTPLFTFIHTKAITSQFLRHNHVTHCCCALPKKCQYHHSVQTVSFLEPLIS